MRKAGAMGVFAVLLTGIVALSGCGNSGSASTGGGTGQTTGSVFVVGTDASLPSIVSCQMTVTGISIFNGTTNVSVLNGSQDVDFARLSGLHQLLDLTGGVPTGTYTSATVTLANPQIGYIDTSKNPPAISTIAGTLSQSSVTVNFANPVTINNADLDGLRMELDIAKSLAVSNGQVTGTINPVFHMQLLSSDNANVAIDDFRAGVVAVTGTNTFIVQGPKGRQWTVQTNASTDIDDPSIPISSFTTSTVVSISGQLDTVTKNIDASEVEVVTNTGVYLEGLFTSIRPPAPAAATAADLFVRSEVPAVNGISDGQITTLTLTGNENYKVANIRNPLTTLLFNNNELVPGQAVAVGSTQATNNGVTTLTVKRVVLERQGQAGAWVPGSTNVQNGNTGSFHLTDNSTAGVLLPSPLTILTGSGTNFIGLSGLSALTGAQAIPIRVVGFVLFNPGTSSTVLVARSVEQLN